MNILEEVDKIEKHLAELPATLNNEGKITELKSHHTEFSERYPTLFEMIVKNGSIDRNIL